MLVYLVFAWYIDKTYIWCKAKIGCDIIYDILAWISEHIFIKLRYRRDGLQDVPEDGQASNFLEAVESLLDSNLFG